MFDSFLTDQIFVTYLIPYCWIIFSFIVVFIEVVIGYQAPYGRYNTKNNGIPVKLAWFIQELPCFVIPSYLLCHYWSYVTLTKFFVLGLFLTHYFQRVFIYPVLIRGGKHSSYLTTILALCFCTLNSYSIAKEILVYHVYPTNDFLSIRFLLGAILFFIGFMFNIQSDAILRNLRKDNTQRDYQIPRGGLFEYVSGANFLAESIEWTGFAMSAWTLPGFAFAVFTWGNIAFGRAIQHHRWYLDKFKDEYPKNRKAIIPFVL